jgi:formamidopyrimidine-DNA glycosylase
MPELPDILLYLRAMEKRIVGRKLAKVVIKSPFLVRTIDPPVEAGQGRRVLAVSRLGKRIVWEFEGGPFYVFHLMIAGRWQWKPPRTLPRGKIDLAAFQFDDGTLLMTEAGSKKRAGLWVVANAAGLAAHQPGGLEPLSATRDDFVRQLNLENHTLKRSLTDPRLFSGIGNAYSDEILHAAGLSPLAWTTRLDAEELDRLYNATLSVLQLWIDRLAEDTGDGWPTKVTAFRPEMAVHGRFGKPCPVCGTKVQRIVYAENETNYCPRCQTGGKLLADRSLSRLLKNDWPRTIEELEGS